MLKCFQRLIYADLLRYQGHESKKRALRSYSIYPGFRFSVWFRLHEHALDSGWPKVARKFLTWAVLRHSLKTGIQINAGARIGGGLYMPHFGGIVVNPDAVIGKNCYLSHNVLIGKVHAGKRVGVPVIGDDVFIGTGACIVGNVKVGNNAVIGLNSVVIDDVPENAFVAGSPARVVNYSGADSHLS